MSLLYDAISRMSFTNLVKGNLDKQHVTKAIISCDLRAFQYPFVLCDTFLLSALCFSRPLDACESPVSLKRR